MERGSKEVLGLIFVSILSLPQLKSRDPSRKLNSMRPSIQRNAPFILIWACLAAIVGCSAPQIQRVEQTTGLTEEIPLELRQRFAVEPSETEKPKTPLPKEKAAPPPPRKVVGKLVYPKRRPAKEPIWIGEKLVYRVSFFGMTAGDFTVEAMPHKTIAGRKAYHIRAKAESNAFFSMIYKLNDVIETYVDYEGFYSHRFHMLLDETKQSRNLVELYDSEKRQAFVWDRVSKENEPYREKKEYIDMEPFPQDTLSALYWLRSIPLPNGLIQPFNLISDGRAVPAAIQVVKRQYITNPALGDVDCVVVHPETGFTGVLKKEGESLMWLTDDDRRILVRLEAKVKVGKIVAELYKADLGEKPTETAEPTAEKPKQ